MKTLLKNAKILSMKDGEEIYSSSIVVEDDAIAYIGENYSSFEPFDLTIDVKGNLIMPGFKNAHAHGAMCFARAITDGESVQDWLYNTIFPMEEHLKESDSYRLLKVSILEYLSSGITAASENYYFVHSMAKAANEMGFRLHILVVPKDERDLLEHLPLCQRDCASGLISYDLGLHSIYTCDKGVLQEYSKILQNYDYRFYIHLSESEKEVIDCERDNNGLSPVEYLDSYGLLNHGGAIYHAIYLRDRDYRILKDKNIYPVTCAGSNAKLASGICPVRELLDFGIPVCVGTDGPASNDGLDFFYEMRLIIALQKIKHCNPAIIRPFEVLKMATVNSAKAMGLNNCLYIDVGQKADLIEIDLSAPSMQPINSIADNIVLSGSKDIVKMTMINGKILYRNHKYFVGQSIKSIYKKAQKATERLKKYKLT